jgi:hypothetical protein
MPYPGKGIGLKGEIDMQQDLSSRSVEGDPNDVSSFAACLRAILQAWGQPIAYEDIVGLNGVVFSPVWDPGEDCTAWWMEGGDDLRLDFLGQALGFSYEKVTREQDFSDDVCEAYAASGAFPSEIAQYLDRLHAAVAKGDGVIVRTWPSWSVLTGWHDDVTKLPFSTVSGFEDLCASIWGPHKSQLAYVISREEPVLPETQAIVDALKFGSQVASGAYRQPPVVYGGALYEAAAAKMGEEFFCPSCKEQDVGCAHRTLRRMRHTQECATLFLEASQRILTYNEATVYAHMRDALARYKDMVEVIEPYRDYKVFEMQWSEDTFRRGLMSDFRKLKALHDEAAETLKALAGNL